jgi:putative ABC transport system permease protein
MTTTLTPPPFAPSLPAAAGTGRRAIRRWAWRLLRREWRQQVLVIGLLVAAVAATIVGLGAIVNVQSSDRGQLGLAQSRIDISGVGGHVGADVAAARQALGSVEAIVHESVPVPGSVTPVDLRAQDPNGRFSAPMLQLVSGSLPHGSGQVAVSPRVASELDVKLGGSWTVDGRRLRVVGVVQNPNDYSDAFAVVPPGQLRAPSSLTLLTDASGSAAGAFRPVAGNLFGIMSNGSSEAQRQRNQALGVLLITTIGLIFIGLLAATGFTVMAHRRLRALGMLGAIGATDRQVRRVMLANGAAVGVVGATTGTLAGLAVWFACRPLFQRLVGHRINPVDIPWWAVAAGAVLAVLTSLAASWWPARAVARMPIIAALSGRPVPPQPAHRFALLGAALAAFGCVLLVLAHGVDTLPIVLGIMATTAGTLLLAPLGIRALASTAGRLPVSARLALRDLVRYQARSGAALAAASLAVGIAATIAVTAAAQQASDHTLTEGNLPANQLVVWLDGNPNGALNGPNAVAVPGQNGGSAAPDPTAVADARRTVSAIAHALGTTRVLELDLADNLGAGASRLPGTNEAILGRPTRDGFTFVTEPFVATPALLRFYGISPSAVTGNAGVLTARTQLARAQLTTGGPKQWVPTRIRRDDRLPKYSSAPNTVITPRELARLGLTAEPAGWLLQARGPLTAAQLVAARHRAAAAGVVVESRTAPDRSLQQLRDYATAVGLVLALGVLAMTVGLIRSETAGDLRTLTATGASGRTRRMLTAATAAALAGLAGVLGTGAAYLALVAWHSRHLGYLSHPPYLQLALLVAGLPVVALIGGFLFGRAPTTIARRPLE